MSWHTISYAATYLIRQIFLQMACLDILLVCPSMLNSRTSHVAPQDSVCRGILPSAFQGEFFIFSLCCGICFHMLRHALLGISIFHPHAAAYPKYAAAYSLRQFLQNLPYAVAPSSSCRSIFCLSSVLPVLSPFFSF